MLERVVNARVARLATHNPSGAIDLVPITFVVIDDAIVTAVDHKPKRTAKLQRLENIRRNPDVTVLVDHYVDDWTALWWVRVRGHATVHDAVPADALVALSDKYEQYRQRPPAGPAIVVRVHDVLAWNAGG
ncbi:MAG TPA: TIGR03668 family PPOX class F420-dependent oxidoreductase [Acidimicrobiales bacterium]|nr:TIGR03668 family PPOX class F420-dependent oxidoreductase [Acidimicrobiales bacterium]